MGSPPHPGDSTTAKTLPPTPRKLQYEELRSLVEQLSSNIYRPTSKILLENVDKSVLATLLAKKRSELQLLRFFFPIPARSATRRRSKRNSSLKFPNYEVGSSRAHRAAESTHETPSLSIAIPNPAPQPPPQQQQQGNPRRSHRNTISDHVSAQRSPHTQDSPSDLSHTSPLSPTFGPRQGELQSGTLSRRRASLPSDTPNNPADYSPGESGKSEVETRNPALMAHTEREQRILADAAWKEIEANFEAWVDRFGEGVEGATSKEGLWAAILGVVAEMGDIMGNDCGGG